jgi:hypothetical protein
MTKSIESAVEAVNDAAAAFIAARAHVVTCQTAVRVKRQSVAAAIANGRASFPIISREQLVRPELAANQAHKLALARGLRRRGSPTALLIARQRTDAAPTPMPSFTAS